MKIVALKQRETLLLISYSGFYEYVIDYNISANREVVKDVNSPAEFNDDLQTCLIFIGITLLLHMHIGQLSLPTSIFL